MALPSPKPFPKRSGADTLPSISHLEYPKFLSHPPKSQVESNAPSEDSLINNQLAWSESVEIMLAKWCDEAKCFEWMHSRVYAFYDRRAKVIGISSAILNALSGFANVVIGGQNMNGFQMSWIFGGLSILVSIVGILQDKLGYSRLATEHRTYCTQWSIIRRKIEEALSIPPESRKDCVTFLKYLRQDINQVSIDGNAQIPTWATQACYDQFHTVKDFDLPDICGDMEHTRIYDRGGALYPSPPGDPVAS